MGKIKLYTREMCSWCIDAKAYLKQRGLAYEEIDVGLHPAAYAEMQQLSGQRYVPTLTLDGKVLANFDVAQLEDFLKSASPGR